MQKRLYMFFNFFAFNLLFFALYLNFIHKDAVAAVPMMPASQIEHINSPAVSGQIKSVIKERSDTQKTSKKVTPAKNAAALKLSMN